jgi:hypothetical protein
MAAGYVTRCLLGVNLLVFSRLSSLGGGFVLAPIPRMGFAPRLNLLQPGGTAKAITAARFAQPPPLAGGLAGLTTSRRRTVLLARVVAVVRNEQLFAATALPSGHSEAHAPGGRKKKPLSESRKRTTKKTQSRRRKKGRQREWQKKTDRKEDGISNRRFSATFNPPATL